MADNDISLEIRPIANGYLVSAHKTVDGYRTAYTPQTYVATREEIIAGLPSLYEAAECLSLSDAKDDF